jgi:hypothetical protein
MVPGLDRSYIQDKSHISKRQSGEGVKMSFIFAERLNIYTFHSWSSYIYFVLSCKIPAYVRDVSMLKEAYPIAADSDRHPRPQKV